MFWSRKKSDQDTPERTGPSFADAKEATRRAAFLNTAGKMSPDIAYRQSLAELFRVCRSAAINAGTLEGFTQVEIDKAIEALCHADVERLKAVTDDEFRLFAQESGKVVNAFLAALP